MLLPGDRKPEIDYPCRWSYTLIGGSEKRIRAAVSALLGDTEHTLQFSHLSKHGNYCSLHLELEVRDEEHRLSIYRDLHGLVDIRMVL